MTMSKRTCFSITGSGGEPFVIRANGYGVRMLKAGFGIRNCSSGSSFRIALVRKDIHITSHVNLKSALVLGPSDGTYLRGSNELGIVPISSCGPCH